MSENKPYTRQDMNIDIILESRARRRPVESVPATEAEGILPEQYRGRWTYDYDEKSQRFQICTGGFCVAETEDSEVADFICKRKNDARAEVVRALEAQLTVADEFLAKQKAEVERLQQAIRYECEQKIVAIEELHRSSAREEDTRYELATAESRLAEVMGVLREHEWNPPSWMCRREKCCGQCPICLSHNEHKPACWLAALLKGDGK